MYKCSYIMCWSVVMSDFKTIANDINKPSEYDQKGW